MAARRGVLVMMRAYLACAHAQSAVGAKQRFSERSGADGERLGDELGGGGALADFSGAGW